MNQKKLKIDFTNVKKIISTISIDKWILMGIAGVVLVFCSDSCNPLGENQNNGSNVNNNAYSYKADNKYIESDEYIEKLERRLEDILESVDGAGNVKVMVTLKSSSRKEVLTEEPYTEKKVNENDGDGGSRDTYEKSQDYNVIFDGENGENTPFIVSESCPRVEGVAVVAEGGDNPFVKEKITGIIKALFGIEINKIAVGKLK